MSGEYSYRVVCAVAALTVAHTALAQMVKTGVIETIERKYAEIRDLRVECERAEAGEQGHYVAVELIWKPGELVVVDGGHGWRGVDWREYYGRSRSYLRNGHMDVEWPNKLAWEEVVLSDGQPIERLDAQSWIKASGYWPLDGVLAEPRIYGLHSSVLAVCRDDRYQLMPGRRVCFGADCVVVAAEGDELCLDAERGYALRERRTHVDGRLAMETSVSELEQVGECWWPKQYRISVSRSGDGEVLARPIILDVRVTAVQVNQSMPEEMCLRHRPGELRLSRRDASKFEQTRPGGLEFLVRLAQDMRAARSREEPRVMTWMLTTVCSLIVVIGVGMLGKTRARESGARRHWRRA